MKKEKCPFCKQYATVIYGEFVTHGPASDGSFDCEGSKTEYTPGLNKKQEEKEFDQ